MLGPPFPLILSVDKTPFQNKKGRRNRKIMIIYFIKKFLLVLTVLKIFCERIFIGGEGGATFQSPNPSHHFCTPKFDYLMIAEFSVLLLTISPPDMTVFRVIQRARQRPLLCWTLPLASRDVAQNVSLSAFL
jgi:hypothetical protein